jgi:hypothetical protein
MYAWIERKRPAELTGILEWPKLREVLRSVDVKSGRSSGERKWRRRPACVTWWNTPTAAPYKRQPNA